MSIAHLLEDFSVQASGGPLHLLDDDALEEQRLAAFEKGYGAGWEDAAQAQEGRRGQISSDLAQSLEDLSFTYHEAMTRMTLSLEPMFNSLMEAVLPEVLHRALPAHVVEQLCDMARQQVGQPMQLFVPEGRAEDIKALLPDGLNPPPVVVEDTGLAPGLARLQVGVSQREVNCDDLLTQIGKAFDAYVFEAKEVLANE